MKTKSIWEKLQILLHCLIVQNQIKKQNHSKKIVQGRN